MNTIRTISDVLRDKADETKKGITFVENRRDVLVPYGRVHAEAVAAATRLAEAGIGPFEVHADSLARACIDSGTRYIDVNDSIDARRAIMALDGDARREGVPVLTGFGLCPGLSTALLMLGACAAGAEEVRDVRVDLRIGADQESGAASVESMFRTIRGGYRAMLGGAIVEVRRNLVSSQSGIGYECPDIDVVRGVCPSILGFSYHVAFDALPDESVEKIRTSRLYAMPVVSGLLARLGAAVTSRKARAKGTPQPAELVIALSSAGAGDAGSAAETTVVRATGPGSYKMTAAIAAATVASVAGKPVAPGCRDLVSHPRLLEPVLAFARDAGIHIETPHDNPTTGPLPAAAHCDTKEKEKR